MHYLILVNYLHMNYFLVCWAQYKLEACSKNLRACYGDLVVCVEGSEVCFASWKPYFADLVVCSVNLETYSAKEEVFCSAKTFALVCLSAE